MLNSYQGVVAVLLKFDGLFRQVWGGLDMNLERVRPGGSRVRVKRDRHPHHARQRVGNQSGAQAVGGSLKIGQCMRAWLTAAHMLELPNRFAGRMVLAIGAYVDPYLLNSVGTR
jgi:hypothetical protein